MVAAGEELEPARQHEQDDDDDAEHFNLAWHAGRHRLSCLTWCGFVYGERHGRSVRYRLADDFPEHFLALARRFLDENANAVGCCTVLHDEERH